MKFTNDDFNEFLITVYDAFIRFRMAGLINTRSASTTVSSKTYSPVDNFKRSIKIDPNLFPAFKDQSLCYNCNCSAIATAFTQNVEDIFHGAYVPSTPYDMALFK